MDSVPQVDLIKPKPSEYSILANDFSPTQNSLTLTKAAGLEMS